MKCHHKQDFWTDQLCATGSPSRQLLRRSFCACRSTGSSVQKRRSSHSTRPLCWWRLLCGFRAGRSGNCFGGSGGGIWVLPPIGRLQIADAADAISLAVFVLMGVFMSSVAGLYHRARRRAAEYEIELARRESEEKFRLLVSGVEDYAIFFVDPDGSVSSWNEGAERIKGYTAEEVIGKPFSIFYTPEDIRGGKPEADVGAGTERRPTRRRGFARP